ncbi:MAG: HEPN domain-containing protein, partial [Bacteroidota bacterium]
MERQEHIKYWLDNSEEDWLSANEIATKNERKYTALFLGHLSLEKLLKALYVKLYEQTPPYKHDLVLIAEKCNLELTDEIVTDLKIINEFNIQTRYPDYKNEFIKLSTKSFVKTELKRIKRVREWIKSIIANT